MGWSRMNWNIGFGSTTLRLLYEEKEKVAKLQQNATESLVCFLRYIFCLWRHPEQIEFDAADVMGGIVGLENPPEVPKVNFLKLKLNIFIQRASKENRIANSVYCVQENSVQYGRLFKLYVTVNICFISYAGNRICAKSAVFCLWRYFFKIWKQEYDELGKGFGITEENTGLYTDKKEKKIFLIYKEIQSGAVT